jgi:hypothetical protein
MMLPSATVALLKLHFFTEPFANVVQLVCGNFRSLAPLSSEAALNAATAIKAENQKI